MNGENLVGVAVSVYLTLIAGFAAIAAASAIEEDDRGQLPNRIGKSVTKTSLFLGAPAILAVIVALNSASGSGGGGIMSKEMGLCILGVIGLLGVFIAWLGSFVMGLLGGVVAKNLPTWPAILVVFFFTSGGAPLGLAFFLLQMSVRSGQHP